jgi:hypothetical protein
MSLERSSIQLQASSIDKKNVSLSKPVVSRVVIHSKIDDAAN